MKKIVDDARLIYKVCCLYYEDGMSQQEIGDFLGISRSSVLRMLQEGKKRGIVCITIKNPAPFNYGDLEKKLESMYGLKDVVVIENSVLDSEKESVSQMFGRAAEYLADYFKEGDCIGVTMGYTLNAVAMTNKAVTKKKMLKFVPLVGGISQGMDGPDNMQGNEIARKFSEKFGGSYTTFLSPAVFSDAAMLKYFMQEKAVNYILEEFKNINVVVTGIGIPERVDHTLLKAGYVTKEELRVINEKGAAADISLQFVDAAGRTEPFSFYNSRVAAMPLADMKKIPHRIGVASGERRAEAVKAAIRGGYINVLITNAECAEKLLQ